MSFLLILAALASVALAAPAKSTEQLPILPGEWEILIRIGIERDGMMLIARKCMTVATIREILGGKEITVSQWPGYIFEDFKLRDGRLTLTESYEASDRTYQPLSGSYSRSTFWADNAELFRTIGAPPGSRFRLDGRRVSATCAVPNK